MSELFLTLVNMSITAGWLVLCVMLLRLLLKKAPKWLRVALWGLVGLRLALPLSIESVLSLVPSAETISPEIIYSETPAIQSGIPAVNAAVNPVISGSFSPAAGAGANPLQIWVSAAAIAWLVGIAALLVYAAVSYLRLRGRVKTAVLLKENIYESENAASPFVLGFFRPRIYLPFGMSEQATKNVVAHEKAHLRRRDHIIKPVGYLLLCVYWFNPLLWLAYILLCRDIELACDERVIKELGHDEKADYSEALLACSVPHRRMVMACPLAFGEVGVRERVKNVLSYKKPAFWIIIVAVAACIVAAVCFLTNPKTEEKTKWAERPTLVMDGVSYIDPYMSVSELPYGYILVGTLSEAQANDTGLAGCEYYAHPGDNDSFFVFQECGTPIDENTVDSEKLQWAYVRWIRESMEGSYARRLTLDDIRFLVRKGDALTWDDFDRYAYTETGSGLYIRVYDIDDLFSLWIGGGSAVSPMYIRLVSKANQDDSIDIRTEDVEAFIAEHGSSVSTVGGVDEPMLVTQSADPLDAAVSAAILEHNAGDVSDGLLHCESHVTLATVSATPRVGESKHEVIVYAMVLYQEYGYSGAAFNEVNGSHLPTALTFEVDADGTHTLTEYWTPRDGSYYVPDIRERFPADVAEDALDTQKYILAQKQSCYAQAVEYGKVDTGYVVEQLLETIMSSPVSSSDPGDYIAAHPVEYRELTWYGDYTLRYVFGEFLKGGQTGLRGNILRSVMDTLIGGEALKLEAATGQEYFDAWREYSQRVYAQNGAASMQENCPKGWLLLQMIG